TCSQRRVVKEFIEQTIPSRRPGRRRRSKAQWKFCFAERAFPVIAESPIEVPRNHEPLLRSTQIVDEEMVLVEGIPVLHQRGGREVIQVFIQIDGLREKCGDIFCRRQLVTKRLEIAE